MKKFGVIVLFSGFDPIRINVLMHAIWKYVEKLAKIATNERFLLSHIVTGRNDKNRNHCLIKPKKHIR